MKYSAFALTLLLVSALSVPAALQAQAPDAGSAAAAATPAATAAPDVSAADTPPDAITLFLTAATSTPPPYCVAEVKKQAAAALAANDPKPLSNLLDVGKEPACVGWLLLHSPQFQAKRGSLIRQVEQEAVAKVKVIAQQEGSSAGTGGSTSVTAKGLTSKVLSIASEYGALTQSTSNQTTTAAGTFAGIPIALASKGYFSDCAIRILVSPCVKNRTLNVLGALSYSVSFPANSSSSTAATATGTGTGTAQQVTASNNDHTISAFSFKWVALPAILNKAAIQKAEASIGSSPALQAMQTAQLSLTKIQAYHTFSKDTPPKIDLPFYDWLQKETAALWAQLLADKTGSTLIMSWESEGKPLVEELDAVAAMGTDPTSQDLIYTSTAALARGYTEYVGAEEAAAITQQFALPPVLSLEYDDNRPSGQPSNSVARVIFQKNLAKTSGKKTTTIGTVTLNGAVSLYNSDQSDVPGAGRLRDVQVAGEIGHDFSVNSSALGQLNFNVSSAGYFQYQSSPSILDVTPGAPVDGVTFVGLPATATKAYAEKGNLGLWQLKVTTGSGSAVKVPLSFTYSNRTELIAKPTWKAQIGISYDFDSLFSK